MTRDEVIALSDERDEWERFAYDLAAFMYQAGYAQGRADQAHADDRAWAAATAERVVVGPTVAELEALRWNVRGERRTRETFGQPHPADHRGHQQPAQPSAAGDRERAA
jgi:hypothetical protein